MKNAQYKSPLLAFCLEASKIESLTFVLHLTGLSFLPKLSLFHTDTTKLARKTNLKFYQTLETRTRYSRQMDEQEYQIRIDGKK